MGVSPMPSDLFLARGTVRLYLHIMRAKKSEKKPGIRRPEVRSLKIQPRRRESFNSEAYIAVKLQCTQSFKPTVR